MPLLCHEDTFTYAMQPETLVGPPRLPPAPLIRRQSQHSVIAKAAIMSSYTVAAADDIRASEHAPSSKENVMPHSRGSSASLAAPQPPSKYRSSIGTALTDTPATTAPNSPRM